MSFSYFFIASLGITCVTWHNLLATFYYFEVQNNCCHYVTIHCTPSFYLFFKDFIYLFLERQGRRKNSRETSIGCLLHTPQQGTRLQPRNVPWPGTEPRPFTLCDDVQPSHAGQGTPPHFKCNCPRYFPYVCWTLHQMVLSFLLQPLSRN